MYTLLIPISQNRSSTSLQNSYMAHLEEMENPRESQGNVSTSKLMVAFIGRFICFICGKILEQGVKGTKNTPLCTNLCKKTPSNQMSQVKSHFHHSHNDGIKLATNVWVICPKVSALFGRPPGHCFLIPQMPEMHSTSQKKTAVPTQFVIQRVSREVFPESKVFFLRLGWYSQGWGCCRIFRAI